LLEDLDVLNAAEGEDVQPLDNNETLGSYEEEEDNAFLLGTRFDVGDDLDNPFRDLLRGKFTTEETLSINLLRLLHAIQAPTYAYRQVMKLIAEASHQKLTITSTFRSRQSASQFLTKRLKLFPLVPQVQAKIGSDQRSYPGCSRCLSHD